VNRLGRRITSISRAIATDLGARRFLKRLLGPIAIWAVVPLVILGLPLDLPEITGLIILLFPLTVLVLLVFFLALFIVALVRRRNRISPLIAMLLVALIGEVYFSSGLEWGTRLHLLVNRGRYEATIAQLSLADSAEEREAICGDDCSILTDDPLRVTFHTCHSFLYWPDIVYDPTGAVTETDVTKLHRLNAYLFGAKRLTGAWYLANFGD